MESSYGTNADQYRNERRKQKECPSLVAQASARHRKPAPQPRHMKSQQLYEEYMSSPARSHSPARAEGRAGSCVSSPGEPLDEYHEHPEGYASVCARRAGHGGHTHERSPEHQRTEQHRTSSVALSLIHICRRRRRG
eukprot:TRINITY_DN18775_c0_g1_i1.p2 TRINITY_DN18775_c0_g1~~TRINITY_DN18775_c0_g1_i1.p2  ORF type:complete len:137 (-),score=16.89 TRINITY_DN18775_c0_g1_i1:6-416(-)